MASRSLHFYQSYDSGYGQPARALTGTDSLARVNHCVNPYRTRVDTMVYTRLPNTAGQIRGSGLSITCRSSRVVSNSRHKRTRSEYKSPCGVLE